MKRTVLFYIFFLITFVGLSQNQQKVISFDLNYGEESVKPNQWYNGKTDTFQFETFKFFISNLEFLYNDSVVYSPTNSYYLIDLEDSLSQEIKLSVPTHLNYTNLRFNLGIDSATNTSGARGGALDPTNGMYWTWQSGYINIKLEGKSKQCTARKNFFQFHLGGYLPPFYPIQSITIPVSNQSFSQLVVDLKSVMNQLNLAQTSSIMSPKKEAVTVSKIIATSIHTANE